METYSIEQRFSAAARYARTLHGRRGFNARIAEATRTSSANIAEIFNHDKGCPEEKRRRIARAIFHLEPSFPAKYYEDMIDLGGWILSGRDPEDWAKKTKEERFIRKSEGKRSSGQETGIRWQYENNSEVITPELPPPETAPISEPAREAGDNQIIIKLLKEKLADKEEIIALQKALIERLENPNQADGVVNTGQIAARLSPGGIDHGE